MAVMDNFDNIEFAYDSQKRRHPAIEELLDSFKYRDMIFQFVRRDVVARYKRSILGVFWTMLQPLGMMLVMAIVFSKLFNRVEGYAAYLLSGLIAWTFFSQTTVAALQQVVSAGSLTRRIYVPHTAFAISSLLTGAVNLVFSMVPLILITLVVKKSLSWAVLFIPISIVILSVFALGVGLILSTFAVYFPDIREMYQIVLQGWMYLTPIIYPDTILPEPYRFWILHLNPMYYMISLFRDPVYTGTLPSIENLVGSLLFALLTLFAGWIYFSNQADEFAYRA